MIQVAKIISIHGLAFFNKNKIFFDVKNWFRWDIYPILIIYLILLILIHPVLYNLLDGNVIESILKYNLKNGFNRYTLEILSNFIILSGISYIKGSDYVIYKINDFLTRLINLFIVFGIINTYIYWIFDFSLYKCNILSVFSDNRYYWILFIIIFLVFNKNFKGLLNFVFFINICLFIIYIISFINFIIGKDLSNFFSLLIIWISARSFNSSGFLAEDFFYRISEDNLNKLNINSYNIKNKLILDLEPKFLAHYSNSIKMSKLKFLTWYILPKIKILGGLIEIDLNKSPVYSSLISDTQLYDTTSIIRKNIIENYFLRKSMFYEKDHLFYSDKNLFKGFLKIRYDPKKSFFILQPLYRNILSIDFKLEDDSLSVIKPNDIYISEYIRNSLSIKEVYKGAIDNRKITILSTVPCKDSILQIIESNRLIIRPLVKTDIYEYHYLVTEREAMFRSGEGPTYNPKDIWDKLIRKEDDMVELGVFLKDFNGKEKELLGKINIVTGHNNWPSLIYVFKQEHWYKGYGTESVNAFVQTWWSLPRTNNVTKVLSSSLYFKPTGEVIELLRAITYINNRESINLLQKVGFQYLITIRYDFLDRWWKEDKMHEWILPKPIGTVENVTNKVWAVVIPFRNLLSTAYWTYYKK